MPLPEVTVSLNNGENCEAEAELRPVPRPEVTESLTLEERLEVSLLAL